ncbi:MAG: uroporphyrinogen decarboxylase, partial [Planctomycetes bacterium]|nr:uroporphyrinogen decarboxylase [Planctomycetota bacterium]
YQQPATWAALMERLVETLAIYLAAQVAAGASALQIFDSWVGNLTRDDFTEFVAPWLNRLVASVPAGVPVIVFGTDTGHLIHQLAATGCDVVGVDANTDLDAAWTIAGGPGRVAVQGNLDPCLLLGPRERLLAGADAVIAAAAGRPGHIFNLGHGVMKETDPEQAVALVRHVHERTMR